MQYSQEHLKTMVYAEFGGQTECIMGNWKIENLRAISKYQTPGGLIFGGAYFRNFTVYPLGAANIHKANIR